MAATQEQPAVFWSSPAEEILQRLHASAQGLSGTEAQQRIWDLRGRRLKPKKQTSAVLLLLSQFISPLVLLLIFTSVLSYFLSDHVDAVIIMGIVVISGALGFWQEYGANRAVEKLLALVRTTMSVLRDGALRDVPILEVVPGDVVALAAGGNIPGDCLLLEAKDLFVDEATLTGETYPVEKQTGVVPAQAVLAQRSNAVFMGTHVVSGTAKAIVVHIGLDTEFGKISGRLRLKPPETEFEHGIRHFGYFLMEITLLLVMGIFAVNVLLHRSPLESFMFSLALAVGLTPQLLPAIISINLARGARRMAEKKVIVKRLMSIENFGSMNVLCCDKTGTLTEGKVQLHAALGLSGQPSDPVFTYAYLNASYQTGFANPIDQAILSHQKPDVSGFQKLDEVPYDFIRKRLSILVARDQQRLIITKGALRNILDICKTVATAPGTSESIEVWQERIEKQFNEFSQQGFRTLALATRDIGPAEHMGKDQEKDMTFLGFLLFFDPPKADIAATITRLKQLGVSLKIITGDNHLVADHVRTLVGLTNPNIITGDMLRQMSESALIRHAQEVEIFAEVEPNQKERIILALKKASYVVGFMGDGINDAPALHAADVGISVDSAADVAKDAADIVLLDKGLDVLVQGVTEGRRTFANTLKYVFMATSANFGNMFSMAGASLFLPFLPLLPKQILLTNLLTDFPEMTIATDNVDAEYMEKPRRWNIKFIRIFMLVFGLLSSVFDFLTFGVLLWVLKADPVLFRTGWFLESVASAALIVLLIRTRRPAVKSRPGKYLVWATGLIVLVTLALPYTPWAAFLGFKPLPLLLLGLLAGIVTLYALCVEWAKKIFYKHVAL
jgi:Mg2+-importing ATPase